MAPVLAYPTSEGHFLLRTDSSSVALGAVLEQDQEEHRQVNRKIITCMHLRLSLTQRCYCTTKELIVALMVLGLFCYYLRKLFYNDHQPCEPNVGQEVQRARGHDSSFDHMATIV